DGIRDDLVTGVQTCALPILSSETCCSNCRTCSPWLSHPDSSALMTRRHSCSSKYNFAHGMTVLVLVGRVIMMNAISSAEWTRLRSEERRVGKGSRVQCWRKD